MKRSIDTSEKTIIKRVWSILSSDERRRGIFLAMLMMVGMGLEILGVGMVMPAIVLMTESDLGVNYPALQPLLNIASKYNQQELVVVVMISLVTVFLIKNLFLGYLVWKQADFTFDVQAQLSQRLFCIYLRQPYVFHLQRNSAELIHNVINEVSQFGNRGVTPILQLCTEGMVVLGITGLLFTIEPYGVLVVAFTLGVAAWGFHFMTSARIARWGKERIYHEKHRLQHLQQGLGGVKDVLLFGREGDFIEQFWKHNKHSATIGKFQATMSQLPRLWLELLSIVGLAVLVLTMVSEGKTITTIVPMLAMFTAAAFRLMPSVYRMLGAVQSLKFIENLGEILQKEVSLHVNQKPREHASNMTVSFHNTLQLENIFFSYSDSHRPVIEELSMTINKGESIGFIGASGSGKSTIIDIILGLLTPGEGRVLVDGRDICKSLRSWQDQIGYVPQSIYLTDDTFRRNIAFGIPNEEINDEAVWRAMCAARLDGFVSSLPEGLETMVGERGTRLSGGQRQRIGVARALYHNPPVLVLDEATSALDIHTESEVMRSITALKGDKTILIVAHRLSTIEHCDRVYNMCEGRVMTEEVPGDMRNTNREVL